MGAREVLLTIHGWMARLRRAVMANRLKTGALAAAAGLVAITLLLMVVEALGNFSGTVRAVLLALWIFAALIALGLGIVWPVLRYTLFAPDDKKLAGDFARRIPNVRDRVLNALQLLERAEGANREGYSPDLILEAGREVAEDLQPIDPHALPDPRSARRFGRAALVTVGFAVVLLLLAGGPLLRAADRVLKPNQEFEPPAPFTLAVSPGDVELVRGDSLLVEVRADGAAPASIILERLERGKTAGEPVTLKSQAGIYRFTYRGISAPFSYWAHEGRVRSEVYDVSVQELPAVRFLSLWLLPPSYTGIEEQVLEENVGDVAAVVGTKVKLQLAATKSLKEARLEFLEPENAGTAQETIRERRALDLDGTRASAEFTVNKSGYYRLRLADTDGLTDRDPILYRITARPDEYPVVNILQPPNDLEIAAGAKVPLVAEALDDFGFSRMQLRYHRTSAYESAEDRDNESQYDKHPLDLRLLEPGKAVSEMAWDMTPLDLLPEDQVVYFVEVWDNDAVSGPKRARSETRTLRFPSMSEIFEKQEEMAQSREISLSDLLKESAEVRDKVEKTIEEYKSNPDLSWERKKEIEQLMEKQRAMNDMLNQISDAMEKASEQMEQRSMFSPEVMDKMREIQKLVQEVITPEMRAALEKMAQAMQQPTEEEMRQALENFKMTQEMFERALDQTLNMLQQLKMEKKLDELTRRLDELGRQQEQLNEKMDQNTPENSQKNADEQKKLAEEMKKIEEEARKLAEEMKQQQTPGQNEMQQAQQKMQEENLSQQMQENSQSMSMCQNQSAKKKGRQARRKMAEMANMLQNVKQSMQQDQMAEVQEKLDRIRDQLLDLSQRQEKLWRESEGLEAGSPLMAQASEEQENLRQAVSRVNEDLRELARQTMFVTPQLVAGIYNTLAQMQQAAAAGQERDPRTASHYRKQALGALNSALKQSQQACSNCKSQCNKPNPNSSCNKAGQMAQQQQNLNQRTQDMMGQCQNPGSLTTGEQAAMQRLAVEQQALAKTAKQLAQEAAANQQSLGRLEDVAKEMEEVAKDLENRNVTQRTMEKQEHIESRLLDFQRANREREFSPRRQSSPGIDMVRSSPAPLPENPGQDQLRQDLLRALDAKYTPDYEQLIRAYFEALSKWK
ncbi:MAG: DUF4175 family protein [Calditrichota bacterium]